MAKLVDVGSIACYFESLSDPRRTRNRKHSGKRFAEAVRGHWGFESMHWTLDVTFREDDSRTRAGDRRRELDAGERIRHSPGLAGQAP